MLFFQDIDELSLVLLHILPPILYMHLSQPSFIALHLQQNSLNHGTELMTNYAINKMPFTYSQKVPLFKSMDPQLPLLHLHLYHLLVLTQNMTPHL
jgi:hypothetical protein